MKIIEIMDYQGKKEKVKIDNFEDVVRLEIEVLSGDEVLYVLYKDYSAEKYDSSENRTTDYNDGSYLIYDITKNIDDIDNWSKRTSSYGYELEENNEK